LGTGTPDATTFLRGDGAWAVPAGGTGGGTHPDLAAHDTLGLATQTELDAKVDKTGGVINNYLDYTAISDPVTPAAGLLRTYIKKIADRGMFKVIGPAGRDYPLQPSFFQNTIALIGPNTGVSLTTFATATATVGTVSHPAKTEAYGYMSNFATAATASATTGTGNSVGQWHRGTIAGGANGFFLYERLAWPDASYNQSGLTTGSRIFVGLTLNSLSTSVNGDTPLGDIAGFERRHTDTGAQDTNWQFQTRDNLLTNTVDTGMFFAPGKVYDFYIYCRPHPDNGTIFWRIDNITDGTTFEGSTSNNLPRGDSVLRAGFQLFTVNAVVRNVRMNRIYCEADR
jgi:hypothetical protein